MIRSALGEHFPIFQTYPSGISILIIQGHVLGAWEEKGSNPSMTADLCKQGIKGENAFGLCVSEPIFCQESSSAIR